VKPIVSQNASTAIGEAESRHLRKDSLDHFVDVVVGPAGELGRQRVGGEQGGAHVDRETFTEQARDAQRLQLGGQREPVARLDLDRRHAMPHRRLQPARRFGEQGVGIGVAGLAHRRDDAAAGAGDRFVARPFEPHLELARAVAGVDEVGVAVDQARGQQCAVGVDLVANRASERRFADADGSDPPTGDRDESGRRNAAARVVAADDAGVADQQVDRGDAHRLKPPPGVASARR